jgi:hypothetical protein
MEVIKLTSTRHKIFFQGGNTANKQKLLGLINKLQTIVERMKFAGDETKSVASAADVEKTEAASAALSEVKITPAAFVQGKLTLSFEGTFY